MLVRSAHRDIGSPFATLHLLCVGCEGPIAAGPCDGAGSISFTGLADLRDQPRSGRPDVRLPIAGHRDVSPAGGLLRADPSPDRRRVAGTGISASQADRILTRLDLVPHNVRSWLNRRDDDQFWAQSGT